MRLIDADELQKNIHNEYDLNYGEQLINPKYFDNMVEDAPTVQTVNQKELEAEIVDLRNELCLHCGIYRNAHKGACDWCRWRRGE
jgi:hypothetical protein